MHRLLCKIITNYGFSIDYSIYRKTFLKLVVMFSVVNVCWDSDFPCIPTYYLTGLLKAFLLLSLNDHK